MDTVWQDARYGVRSLRRALPFTLAALATLALGRLLSSQVFGVEPVDPLTFIAVRALLIPVAGTATLMPALQASRPDPMRALRLE